LPRCGPQTIITGHRDLDAPDEDARRVLDQSRQYLEDFDEAVKGMARPRKSLT
jgi:hypothetical protein